jgi:cytochrome c
MKKLIYLLPVAAIFLAARPAAPTEAAASATVTVTDPTIPADIDALLNKYGCAACHSIKRKLVGPMWTDVAAKKYSKKRIIALVQKPEPQNWPGYQPMQPQTTVPKADLGKIAEWLVKLGQ